jgi:hypothetical protein
MEQKTKETLRVAFDLYLDEYGNSILQPTDALLSFGFDFLLNRQWRTLFAEFMVKGELRELIY